MEQNSFDVCAHCNHVRNEEVDNDFFSMNSGKHFDASDEWTRREPPRYTSPAPELLFCSTNCVIAFLSDEKNRDRIGWLEKDKLPQEPEEVATSRARYDELCRQGKKPTHKEAFDYWRPLMEAHGRWERTQEGRFLCDYSDHISKAEREEYRVKHGIPEKSFWGMPLPAVNGPCLYISMWGQQQSCRGDKQFCCIAHAIAWCGDHAYDAKGYWLSQGLRCTECGSVQRRDLGCDQGLSLWAVMNGSGKERRHFCTPMCALKHIERGAIDIATCSYEEHVREGWNDHCHSCKQVDKAARFIIIVGPYDCTFDDEIDGHFCTMECFMKALRVEEEVFTKAKRMRWYAHADHPLLSPWQ